MSRRRKFDQGDWVTIKCGEYKGRYGKVCMHEKGGGYVVLPYDKDNEPGAMITLDVGSLSLIEPFKFNEYDLRAFCRGEILYCDIKEDVFPAFNIKADADHEITAADIREAFKNINRTPDCLNTFKEWFWLIINIFYDNLNIADRYDEEIFTDAPETDDEIFCVVYGLCEKLYWRLEERFSQKEDFEKYTIKFNSPYDWDKDRDVKILERSVYQAVCEDIISRVDAYMHNRGIPKEHWIYSDSEKHHIIASFTEEKDLSLLTEDELYMYKRFVDDLYKKGDEHAMAILAWGHYEGNEAYEQDWALSEKFLLELYEKTGDPYAANSLGYIYFYGRVNEGIADYEKAFKYFSFGALAGIDESRYKAADMLINGLGTRRNLDMGLNLIVDGYQEAMADFCEGNYDNKLADYALRMGNACRDNLIYGMGLRDAYKFYLEAEFAIKKRREINEEYGDDQVEQNIKNEMANIREHVGIPGSGGVLRADFPVYINQLFDDRYPVKVSIDVPRDSREGTLTISRLRFEGDMPDLPPEAAGSELIKFLDSPPILASYPELSFAELTSEITYILEEVELVKTPEKSNHFLSDAFRRNDVTNSLEFYAGGEMIAAIEAGWYVVKVKK